MLLTLIAAPFAAMATTYYVSTTGSDSSGVSGSSTQPWRTVAYAATRVTTSGNTIHVYAGTYSESAVITLSTGISLEGEGQANTIITTSGSGGQNTVGALLSLNSSTIVDGNQSISNLTFDGQNFTVTIGLIVGRRNNVTLHDITVKKCYQKDLNAYGVASTVTWPALVDESTQISNFQIYNSTFSDSGQPIYINGVPQNYSYPAVQIYQAKDSSMHHCVFDNTNYGGFNISCRYLARFKVFNCTMTQPAHWPNSARAKGFGLECIYGDHLEFYSNVTNGGVSTLVSNSLFDHNSVIMPPSEGSTEAFECTGLNDTYTFNYVEGSSPAFALWDSGVMQNMTIANNVVRNTSGGAMNIGNGAFQSIHVYNNTFDGCSNPYQNGVIAVIIRDANATINDLQFINNIISNPATGLHAISLLTGSRSSQLTNTLIKYNIFYGATGGDIYDQGSTGTVTSNNSNSNPLFVGGSTYPAPYYMLQSSSSARLTGTGVGLQTLTSPPDRGAFVQDIAVGTRYEAEMNYTIVSDVGSHPINIGGSTFCSYYKINLLDTGDIIRVNFNVPANGTYTLYVRLRCGGTTGQTVYWPNGYVFMLDGVTPVTLTGDTTTVSTFDSSGGGTYWGTMKGAVTLTKGNHNLQISDVTPYSFIDYLELH